MKRAILLKGGAEHERAKAKVGVANTRKAPETRSAELR